MMRRLAVKSLRTVSGMLDTLAESLDVVEEKGDIADIPIVSSIMPSY